MRSSVTTTYYLAILAATMGYPFRSSAENIKKLGVDSREQPSPRTAATGKTEIINIENKVSKIINALDKGVVCDGVADNKDAFAQAIGSLHEGYTLYIPPQSLPCLTSAALSLPSNTRLYANAGTVTIKPTYSSTASPLLLSEANVSNVSVFGITFNGGGVSDFPSMPTTLQVFSSTNVIFDNVTITATSGIGLLFSTNVQQSGIRNSRIVNVGNYWTVKNLLAYQKQGVAFCCGKKVTLARSQDSVSNLINLSTVKGIEIGQLVSGHGVPVGVRVISISGNNVTLSRSTTVALGLGEMLDVSSSSFNFANHNYFSRTGLDAVSASSQQHFSSIGNVFDHVGGQYASSDSAGLGGAAVYASNVDGLSISLNSVLYTYGNGLDLIATNGAVISNNIVRFSGDAGICVADSSNTLISGNTAMNSNQGHGVNVNQAGISISGVHLEAENVTVGGNTSVDNQFKPTQTYGIQALTGSKFSNLRIDEDNVFSRNAASRCGGDITAPICKMSEARATSGKQKSH